MVDVLGVQPPFFGNPPLNGVFELAVGAALAAAGMQDYPQGMRYVVATPIGNLADISLR